MPEPHRLHPAADDPSDRDVRAEALLVAGLDRYFAADFEEAIHIWTRVLFLDRTHPRARAYIDRARSAIAERQRAADELLHATAELLTQGEAAEARRVLTQAVRATGDDERAAVLRTRIDRLELAARARPIGRTGAIAAAPPEAAPLRAQQIWTVAALVAGVVLIAASWTSPAVRDLFSRRTAVLPARVETHPMAVLSAGEVALVRARTLYARGRLAEALQALDRVGDGIRERADADRLRVEIQQVLLAASRTGPRSGPPAGEGGRAR